MGYAHALGKTVILLTSDAEDIPFGLKHYPHIVYSGKITNLRNELERRVRWVIENPADAAVQLEEDIEFFIDGVALGDQPKASNFGKPNDWTLRFKLDAHNRASKSLRTATFGVGLITEGSVQGRDDQPFNEVLQPDGSRVHISLGDLSVLPGSSGSLHFGLTVRTEELSKKHPMTLRISTLTGTRDIPFTLGVLG